MGSKGHNSTFLEYGHVSYHNKVKSQMQQHGSKHLSHRSPLTLGMGSIGKNSTFSEHGFVAYQIKWNH